MAILQLVDTPNKSTVKYARPDSSLVKMCPNELSTQKLVKYFYQML